MLNQLDALIGFAVVMTVVSLLITIITQIISSLLGLRGKNLADALEAMVHKIAPDINEQAEGLAKQLVDKILTHPIISDSTLSVSRRWGKLEGIARIWKRASAIRPEEFLGILQHFAGVKTGESVDAARLESARSAFVAATRSIGTGAASGSPASGPEAPGVRPKSSARPPESVEDLRLKFAATKVLFELQHSKFAADAGELRSRLAGPAGPELDQAKLRLQEIEKEATTAAPVTLERWFNSAQDRAKQWFAMHARIWTVTAALLMAFLLQLDMFRLITQLAGAPDLRAKLINLSQATLQKKADEVFTNILSQAAINSEALRHLKSSSLPRLKEPPAGLELQSRAAVEAWLESEALTNHWNGSNVLTQFRTAAQAAARKNYDRAGQEFADLTDAFGRTGLQLMPDPYPPVFAENSKLWSWPWEWRLSGQWSWPKRHLLGILASAALLSLGAPFWFNLLNSLTNLRPLLAKQIDQDKKKPDR